MIGWVRRGVAAVGLIVHVLLFYPLVTSGLVVPLPFLILLLAGWGWLLALAIAHRHDPWFVLAMPLAAAALWIAVVLGLGSLLDWEA